MADGGLLPIEDIEVGDQVLATDPETGVQGPRTVMATIVGDGAKQLVDITAAGATVTATDGHPFWVVDLDSDQGGVWVDAVELQPGDHLVASGGQPVAVTAVATYEAVATVYNRTVEDTHTYHIAVGGTDTLVHNCGKGYKGKHRLHVGKHHADEPVSPKTLLDRARFALKMVLADR